MYYIETETDTYTIVSSYATEKQARRYGGEPLDGYLESLEKDEHYGALFHEGCMIVRTIFSSKKPVVSSGDYCLYFANGYGEWLDSGISFKTYSDANLAVKGPLSKVYTEMAILQIDREERDRISQQHIIINSPQF